MRLGVSVILYGREKRRDDFFNAAKLILLVDVRGEDAFSRSTSLCDKSRLIPMRFYRPTTSLLDC
jgi:hypothetical protein